MKSNLLIIISVIVFTSGLSAVIFLIRSKTIAYDGISVVQGASSANIDYISPTEISNESIFVENHEVDKIRTISDQFLTETKNPGWADETEKTIVSRLYQSSYISKIEVSCKSTICQTTGEFEVSNPDRIDTVLGQIRSAANFKSTDSSTSGVADNTVYSVVGVKPLRIKFSNLSKW